MALEWLEQESTLDALYGRCWDKAARLTKLGRGLWVIRPVPIGWRLIPVPGSDYPPVRALTQSRLFRRLAAAATPRQRPVA